MRLGDYEFTNRFVNLRQHFARALPEFKRLEVGMPVAKHSSRWMNKTCA